MPIECVVRGYLAGSGWKEYRRPAPSAASPLPPGLRRARAAARADLHAGDQGGDRPRREHLVRATWPSASAPRLADELRRRSLDVYRRAAELRRGAGASSWPTRSSSGACCRTGELILIDEVLTPDSSRFWPADEYRVGGNPPSFDKQFVRDWLETTGWDKNSPPPALPADVVRADAREVPGGV